jgi:biotin operon repressor
MPKRKPSPVMMSAAIRRAEILALLRTGRQNTDQLAQRIGCARQTICNDITVLRRQGYVIMAMHNINGSYYDLQKQSSTAADSQAAQGSADAAEAKPGKRKGKGK